MLQGNPYQCGAALSRARRADHLGDVDLRWVRSLKEAQAVQEAAFDGLGGTRIGYTLAATTDLTSRLLNCFGPIAGWLIEDYVHDSGSTIRLPHGTLGAGAQFIFTIGAPVREPVTLRSVADSILSCRMGLQILGRRAAPGVPLNDRSATADCALDVGCVLGAGIEEWDGIGLDAVEISLRMSGNELAKGRGTEVFGGPVRAVLGLAQSLTIRGIRLQAGDLVATGSCTGLTQVVPGHSVNAVFGGCGEVRVHFV